MNDHSLMNHSRPAESAPAAAVPAPRAGVTAARAVLATVARYALVLTLGAVCLLLLAALSAEREERAAELRQFSGERDFVEHKLRAIVEETAGTHQYRGYYVAIDLEKDELRVLRDGNVIHRATCAHGQGQVQKKGRWFDFATPVGRRTVIYKEVDPVWIRPDWAWLERGDTLPRNLTREQREVRGILGKYRLQTGDGYDIHGINGPVPPGAYTHGCVRLNAPDLEMVYKLVEVGAPVYIY